MLKDIFAYNGVRPLLVLCAVILPLAVSCAGVDIRRPSPYYKTLAEWTRHEKVVVNFETKLYLHATYKGTGFRTAYIDEYADRYQLDDDLRRLLLERELATHAEYNEFFMTAYTPVGEWNDFDRKNSVWKLYLSDDTGARVEPVSIKKVDSDDPFYREFFPYFDPWSSAYLVKFPRYGHSGAVPVGEPGSGPVRLTVTGIKGSAELSWEFSRPGGAEEGALSVGPEKNR